MSANYCGKSCVQCPKLLDASCVGCRNCAYSQNCKIAKCCVERGHEFCGTCTNGANCVTRRLRDQMPELMLDTLRRDGEMNARRKERAEKLGKWLWPVFWCLIAQLVITQLDTQWVMENLPVVGQAAGVLAPAFLAAAAVCHLQLRSVDERYRTLGLAQLGLVAYYLVEGYFAESGLLSFVLVIIALVFSVASKYCQCHAHADALYGIDDALADKWMNQWNLHKIVHISLPVISILIFIPLINYVAILAIIAILILLLVVSIRDFVYLYQMAVLLRSYSGDEE